MDILHSPRPIGRQKWSGSKLITLRNKQSETIRAFSARQPTLRLRVQTGRHVFILRCQQLASEIWLIGATLSVCRGTMQRIHSMLLDLILITSQGRMHIRLPQLPNVITLYSCTV